MPVCSKEVPGIVGKTMNRKGTGPMEHSVLAPSNLMREKDQQTGIGDTVRKSCVAGKQSVQSGMGSGATKRRKKQPLSRGLCRSQQGQNQGPGREESIVQAESRCKLRHTWRLRMLGELNKCTKQIHNDWQIGRQHGER